MQNPRCISAANRIINRTNAHNIWRYELGKSRVRLTGMRLQKILYLVELFWYTEHEECEMILENFEAWPNGPVIPEIYDYFSVYQDGDMSPVLGISNYKLNEEERSLINKVVDSTIELSTESIVDYICSLDGLWAQTYKDGQGLYSVISKKDIKQYIRREDRQRELINFIKNDDNIKCDGPVLVKKKN